MLNLEDKDFLSSDFNYEWKRYKGCRGKYVNKSEKIGNVSRKLEIIKKLLNENYRSEKYNMGNFKSYWMGLIVKWEW